MSVVAGVEAQDRRTGRARSCIRLRIRGVAGARRRPAAPSQARAQIPRWVAAD